jgi:putative transposase
MNYIKPEFVNGEIYHIYNRGVEKRDIFKDENDRFRFVFSLYECNDCNTVIMRDRIFQRKERNLRQRPTMAQLSNCPMAGYSMHKNSKRKKLVELFAFCLMPNHYHMIIKQLVDGGISCFMRKLGDSYVKYFNEKHLRKGMGSLFQGKFKARFIRDNDQFVNLVTYIHTNPVGIAEKNWKENGISDIQIAIDNLNYYRWSSYSDYIGKPNFPSIINKVFTLKAFAGNENDFEKQGAENIKKFANNWIKHKGELFAGLSRAGI